MAHKRPQRGQLVGASGLRKMAGPPGSSFKIVVVDRQGRPVSHLSKWYRRRQEPGPDRTRQTYLGMLFPVVGFFLEREYAWNDPPEQVRSYLLAFLRERLACRLQPDQDREGYWIETSRTSPLSKSSLGVLLAAIKDFYRVMHDAGYYIYPSPMTSQLLEQWRRERARLIASAGAPDHAGIRSESWEESQRHPIAYFRQGKRKAWQPKLVLESAEVRERMGKALIYMTQHAPTQRDKVVLLLLRHTGARLHEILGMTVGGYQKAAGPLNALVVNKGSFGREEKLITLLDTDEEELLKYIHGERGKFDDTYKKESPLPYVMLKYIHGERGKFDPLGRTQLAELDETDPLFLTVRRTPYADAAFRHHWNHLIEQVKKRYRVSFTPHAIRHLFVTQHLVWIKEEAGDDREEQQRLKAGLVQIMGWHSRETMRIYDHTFSLQEAVRKLHEFQRKAEQQALRGGAEPTPCELASSREEIVIIEESESPDAFTQLWEELV